MECELHSIHHMEIHIMDFSTKSNEWLIEVFKELETIARLNNMPRFSDAQLIQNELMERCFQFGLKPTHSEQ